MSATPERAGTCVSQVRAMLGDTIDRLILGG